MLRVTIELLPGGNENRKRTLGIANIANDLEDSAATGGLLGSYVATLSKWAPKTAQTWKRTSVRGFDRKARGPWDLLFLVLLNAVGKRNGVPLEHVAPPRERAL